MGFVPIVGGVVMGFVASHGCGYDGFCGFFFSNGGDGGGWQWVVGFGGGFLFFLL